jgi:glycosyltransferase involved in cell wall biosynthesis
MNEEKKISVIIPAYNEEDAIGKVLGDLLPMADANGWEVIVVDDGSTDATAKVADQNGVKVITHPYNRGYGSSLKTGITSASGNIVVIMDSDGQHDPGDISRLLEHINDHDVVIGERVKGSHHSWIRRPGKWLLGKIANFLTGRKIPDINSGLRAYQKDLLLKLIHLMPNGFSFSTTSTVAYYSMNFRVKYIPIKTKQRTGKSTVNQIKHGCETILLMLRLIVLFNPLKVFMPVSLFLIFMALAYQIYIICLTGLHVVGGAIVSLIAGIQIFLFGLMIDQISSVRREKYL